MDLSRISRRGAQDTFDASHFIPQCWEPGSEDPRSNVPLCPLRRRSLPRQRCRGRRGGVQEITSETLEKSWNHLQNIHHTFANHQTLSDWNNEGCNDSQEVDGLLQGDVDGCRQLRHRLQPEYQPLHKGSSTSCHLQHRFCNFHHFTIVIIPLFISVNFIINLNSESQSIQKVLVFAATFLIDMWVDNTLFSSQINNLYSSRMYFEMNN